MPDHFYIYPSYLTAVSRALGRRVPRDSAHNWENALEQMQNATKKMGFDSEVEEKHYPRKPDHDEGRLKVMKRKGVTKAAFLKALSKELSKQRNPG